MATVREKCARFPKLRGRLITFALGLKIRFGQVHTEVRYPVRGNYILGEISGLVSGLWCLFENDNSKKFSQYFF
jgi:hypothetical protein